MAPFTSCLAVFLLLLQQTWFVAGHGDACSSITRTISVLAGTTVTDRDSFMNSLNSVYHTPSITAGTVYYWSSLYNQDGISETHYAIYNPDALTSAGYSFTTDVVVETHCPEPEETNEAMPASSGSSSSDLNGDHAHGDATSTGEESHDHAEPTITATCSPHVDHWHCPSGVESPTTPPSPEDLSKATAEVSTTAAAAATCSPHHDHWHCPPGVESPTTPPGPADSAPITATSTAEATETSSAPTTSSAAAHVIAGRLFECTLFSLLVSFLL